MSIITPKKKKCASKRKSVRYNGYFVGDCGEMNPEDEEYMWRCINKDD